jgi:hypothetical protein
LIDGWNRGSDEAFAAPIVEDDDLVGFDTYVKGSRLVGKVRSVRFLRPDVAIMHAFGGTLMAFQTDIESE